MLLECLTDLGCSLIVLKIILLLAQSQTTLIETQDILTCILLVGTKITEEELLLAIRSLRKLDIQQLLVGLCSLKFLNQRHKWSHTLLVSAS